MSPPNRVRRTMYVQRNVEVRSRNHSCHGKAISITYSECVCVCVSTPLVIQHAKRLHRILLSSEVCPALPHCSTLSHFCYDFRRNIFLKTKCVLILYADFAWNIFDPNQNSVRYCHSCTWDFMQHNLYFRGILTF